MNDTPTTSPVRIAANHAVTKRLGNWTSEPVMTVARATGPRPNPSRETDMTDDTFVSTRPPRILPQPTARWMALGAIAGPVLFTTAWLVLGLVSPGFTIFGTEITPYSPISAGISGLGLGPTGPYMNVAFVLTGLLLGVGVVGAMHRIPQLSARARWTCTVLLCLTPLGSIIDGLYTLESFFPHFVGAGLGFGSPIVTFVVVGLLLRRIPGWRKFANRLLLGRLFGGR
jgi:hypothetical protein